MVTELALTHHSGNLVSAAEHTTITAKVNSVISTVNTHTNLRLTDDSLTIDETPSVFWEEPTNFSIPATTWVSIFTSDLRSGLSTDDHVYFREVVVRQIVSAPYQDLPFLQMWVYETGANPAVGPDVAIIQYDVSNPDDPDYMAFVPRPQATVSRNFIFPLGLYDFKGVISHALTISFYNSMAVETGTSILITSVKITGWAEP